MLGTTCPGLQSPNIFCLSSLPLLGLERKRGGGARQQAAHADRLAGFVAIAVVAGVDAGDGLFDLLEQLALAVARSQLQRVLFFNRCAVGRIGKR